MFLAPFPDMGKAPPAKEEWDIGILDSFTSMQACGAALVCLLGERQYSLGGMGLDCKTWALVFLSRENMCLLYGCPNQYLTRDCGNGRCSGAIQLLTPMKTTRIAQYAALAAKISCLLALVNRLTAALKASVPINSTPIQIAFVLPKVPDDPLTMTAPVGVTVVEILLLLSSVAVRW